MKKGKSRTRGRQNQIKSRQKAIERTRARENYDRQAYDGHGDDEES